MHHFTHATYFFFSFEFHLNYSNFLYILQSRRSNQQQSAQSQVKPAQQNQQQCIILSRPLPNWPASSSKQSSLLHSNTIFLPSSQPYTKIANVQPSSSTGVSLLNTPHTNTHAQGQKAALSETIIIQ